MELTFQNYISQLFENPELIAISILILSVMFANGCIDVPNAIASCVSTRSTTPKKAIIISSIFNFLGVFVMGLLSSTVAQTIYNIANFGSDTTHALIGLTARINCNSFMVNYGYETWYTYK